MPKTKKGNRTEHFGVQIVEEGTGGDITMFFAGYDLPPIVFSAKTGSSGEKAYGKLSTILELSDAKEVDEP